MCSSGHENVVKLLLDKGINLSKKNDDGKTALHQAASKGDVHINIHRQIQLHTIAQSMVFIGSTNFSKMDTKIQTQKNRTRKFEHKKIEHKNSDTEKVLSETFSTIFRKLLF